MPSTNSEAIVEAIRRDGLIHSDLAMWRDSMPDPDIVRQRSSELLGSPATIRDRLRKLPIRPIVYACGDLYGGSYYALRHNHSDQNSVSILIEFEVPWSVLCVDGKDFLYAVFQRLDRTRADRFDFVRRTLTTLYGRHIQQYVDAAAEWSETHGRIGLCDLACHDLDVVRSHHANRCLIAGRFETQFCSSFQVQFPVVAAAVVSLTVSPVMPQKPERQIGLDDLIH